MILLLKTVLFTFLLFFEFIKGQFLTEIPLRTLPTNLNGELESKRSISLLNPDRFNIDQSFKMSVISTGKESYSIAGLSNYISYMPLENLKVDANITLYNSQSPFQGQTMLGSHLDIGYNAGITYQPTKNSFLQIQFQKLPHYQTYQTRSPFNLRHIR